ncbi:T9SS type A sorting domain-containing protein [Winogradskyella schleiferi]|uniref:T9SS type A sorting domain-containing protein n=1 Tax=Winogradskyella schleiferi TaxID=2686078 RepID=UPI0015BFF133|nr:T9SS type A sorting domain-containing protein [Winogradskyella schleiferi]
MKIKLFFLFTCAFFLGTNAQVAFEQNVVIDDSYGSLRPQSIHLADIDNDGFQDILVASNSEIIWRRSIDGQGNFELEVSLLDEFTDTNFVRTGDFDADGDLDIVFLARSGNSSTDVMYSENLDGLGNLSEPISIANMDSALFRLNLQVIDMNNDGDLDIIYSSLGNISWLENDGVANFTNDTRFGDNDGFIAVDVDGDNLVDIVRDNGYNLTAFKINADGSISLIETMSTFALYQDYKAADMDADGDNDIIVLYQNGSARSVYWFENTDGLGTFANSQTLIAMPTISGSSSTDYRGLEVADIDGNGSMDVVVFDSRLNGMVLYKNMGNLVYDEGTTVANDNPSISDLTLGDLNNDNTLDIIVTDFNLSEYSWYSNIDGLGNFGTKNLISSTVIFVNHVDYSDIDGDGDLDLVSSSHADDKIAWYENTNGLGDFSNGQNIISNTTDGARDVFAVDMDGDNDKDVLVSSRLEETTGDYQLIWYENDGTGTFIQEHIFETTSNSILRINYADVDDDGDMDVISGEDNSVLKLYNNNGDGTFEIPIIFSETGFSYLSGLQVADVDGDNDIDVLASYISDEVIWHENDGSGDLSGKHIIIEELSSSSALFVADIDGDNDNDVLFSNRNADEVGYFLNTDGLGTFGPKVITSEIPQSPRSIYSLDIDDDGDMDMITNSNEGQKFIWFPNDGDANFGEPVEITSFIGDISHITSADLNNDGKIDLITSSYDDDQVAWFKNLGAFTNTISGVVRLDADANGCDMSDASLENLLVVADNGTNSFSTFTQADGSFVLQANQESYVTSLTSTLPNYYISNPASHTYDLTGLSNSNSEADFCVEANQSVDDVSIIVYPTINEPRPGFDTTYRLVYKNNGSTILSGTITFEFDDSKISFLSATETVTSMNSNTVSFNYDNIVPFETRVIDLEFNVFTIPTTNIDDELIGTATITSNGNDLTPEDNTNTLNLTVIGAYDPNDIIVLEGEEITVDEIDNYLHYIIRFQNTGTASAINVSVNNILDNKLDWSSIQLQSLSHPGRVEITDGNKIDFIFDNINLPDSTNDEPNSHGFITYKIKPKSDVVVGDIFSNTAAIYFDFNPPIITNTATTEIVSTLSITDFETDLVKLYPNPVNSALTINSKSVIDSISIYDVNGRRLRTISEHSDIITLNVSGLVKGLYFLEVKSGESIQTLKFIKK